VENYEDENEDEGRGRVFFKEVWRLKDFIDSNQIEVLSIADLKPTGALQTFCCAASSEPFEAHASLDMRYAVLTRTSVDALGPQISLLLFLASRGGAAKRETEECLGHSEPVASQGVAQTGFPAWPAAPRHTAPDVVK
jgi:hypothetical protein